MKRYYKNNQQQLTDLAWKTIPLLLFFLGPSRLGYPARQREKQTHIVAVNFQLHPLSHLSIIFPQVS